MHASLLAPRRIASGDTTLAAAAAAAAAAAGSDGRGRRGKARRAGGPSDIGAGRTLDGRRRNVAKKVATGPEANRGAELD